MYLPLFSSLVYFPLYFSSQLAPCYFCMFVCLFCDLMNIVRIVYRIMGDSSPIGACHLTSELPVKKMSLPPPLTINCVYFLREGWDPWIFSFPWQNGNGPGLVQPCHPQETVVYTFPPTSSGFYNLSSTFSSYSLRLQMLKH